MSGTDEGFDLYAWAATLDLERLDELLAEANTQLIAAKARRDLLFATKELYNLATYGRRYA